jgi:FG-GAP-like repeat/IPT/TIG domain/FG-GAP repeat
MKKNYYKPSHLLLFVILVGYKFTTFSQVPTINSFTPVSAKTGDTVTLTGTNFNTTPSNNIVFLGATRATVTAATATSVTVIVPSGATYAPITLLNTGTSLAAYSVSNFTPTYNPSKTAITTTDFQPKQDFSTGIQPSSVAIGDLDGDGKSDLAVANLSSNTVSVFRNTSNSGSIGNGSFAVKVDFATGTNPYSVAIGDLDGDGKPDLVVANASSNTVSVIRNTSVSGSIGSSSFATKVDFTTGSAPFSIAIGDLDGDGKLDLAVANSVSNTVSLFRNTSFSGSIDISSFAFKVDFATGLYPYSIAIGDLDGDGKSDLATVNVNANTVSVLRNTSIRGSIGTGSFTAKVDFTTNFAPQSLAIGDLDGDSKPDLVTANHSSSTVSVIRNTATNGSIGTSSFAPKIDFTTGKNPYAVAIGDMDGDGRPDLATANYGSNTLSILRNTSISGNISIGSFASKVDFTTGIYPQSIAIGDLDGDGKPDLVVGNNISFTVSVIRNADLPPIITTFSPMSAKPGDAVILTGTNFNTIPTNNIVFFGATRATVTAATATSITVNVPIGATYAHITLLNTGTSLAVYSLSKFTPTYSPAKTTITATDFQAKQDFNTGASPFSMTIGDLDGDGKSDLVVANANSNTVSVYRNTSISGSIGNGSFASKIDFTTGGYPRSVAIGDLDGDGKPDLAVVNANSATVSIFRNTSTIGSIDIGSFAPKVDFTTGSSPFSVAIGDLDGDGKHDLVVANLNSSTVSVIRNTSLNGNIISNSFAAKVDFTTGSAPFSVAIGDLDGDGKPDLVVANLNSSTVSVIRNTSLNGNIVSSSFAAKVDFTTGSVPYSVAIGDLDGDGKPDLAVANYGSSTISVYRNTTTSGSIGTSSFAGKVDFTTGTNPYSVAIGDLDGDDKLDLAVANSNSNSSTVSVFRNVSIIGSIVLGSFAAKVDFPTLGSVSVAIGDLDGDNKPELVTANNGPNTISVLRNSDNVAISIKNGVWNDPNTWNINRIPLPSDFIIIDQNHTVEITNTVSAKAIEYRNNAKLSFINTLAKLNIGF